MTARRIYAAATKYVALYVRISVDKHGRKEGVQAQEKWGRAYAAKKWPGVPVKVFCDNDLSAAKDDVYREDYEKLRTCISNGEVVHVWSVEQSRLERREVQWFELAAEMDEAGIPELDTDRDGVVRVRDEVAGIKAVLNAAERRKMLRRQADTLAEHAALGLPPGSRPFGYEHAVNERGERTYRIIPNQAKAIQWAAEKVLAGWSTSHLVTELTKQGFHGAHRKRVKGADGQPVLDAHGRPVLRPTNLTRNSVRSMLTNPTVAGLRVHKGKIVGKGNWRPILDEATYHAVCEKLNNPRIVRRKNGRDYAISKAHMGKPSGRKYLLTGGLGVCHECGHPLQGTVKQRQRCKVKTMPYLVCHPNLGGKGCVGIMLEPVEAYVLEDLFAKLDDPEFLDQVAHDAHAATRDHIDSALAGLKGKRDKLSVAWARNELTDTEWEAARQALAEQEHALRTELAELPPPLLRIDAKTIRGSWRKMTLDERREILRLLIREVRITRATKMGQNGLDRNRVKISYFNRR